MGNDDAPFTIRLALQSASPPKKWWDHTIARAVGGFFLTSVLAGVVGACWQRQHWAEEQAYTARNEKAKVRLELTSSVVRKVSETFNASSQVIYLTILSPGTILQTTRDQQLRTRIEEWVKHNQQWRVEEMVIMAEVKAQFSNQQIVDLLEQIIATRESLFKQVSAFIEQSGGKIPSDDKSRATLLDINQKIYKLVVGVSGKNGLLPKMSELMIQETRADQQVPRGWLDEWLDKWLAVWR